MLLQWRLWCLDVYIDTIAAGVISYSGCDPPVRGCRLLGASLCRRCCWWESPWWPLYSWCCLSSCTVPKRKERRGVDAKVKRWGWKSGDTYAALRSRHLLSVVKTARWGEGGYNDSKHGSVLVFLFLCLLERARPSLGVKTMHQWKPVPRQRAVLCLKWLLASMAQSQDCGLQPQLRLKPGAMFVSTSFHIFCFVKKNLVQPEGLKVWKTPIRFSNGRVGRWLVVKAVWALAQKVYAK